MDNVPQQTKNAQNIAEFTMFDDIFMSAVFDGQNAETELLVRCIVERDDIAVIYSKAQYYVANTYGHENRLDIYAKDDTGRAYHFEVQRNTNGASAKRARYTAAMVDMTLLEKGKEYDELPDRYTIFITEKDHFGQSLPMYHIENKVEELGNTPLNDGGHIIYVNGEYKNTDTLIGQIMHDFSCTNASDMINPLLRTRVRYLKETEGGRTEMCDVMERRINEEKTELAKDAINAGKFSPKEIAEILRLPLEFVENLANTKQATV
jgi:hypothetical protein